MASNIITLLLFIFGIPVFFSSLYAITEYISYGKSEKDKNYSKIKVSGWDNLLEKMEEEHKRREKKKKNK